MHVFLFSRQAALQEKWFDAQVELAAASYEEGSGVPTDPTARLAYFRREAANAQGADLMKFLRSHLGHITGISLFVSIIGFWFWWRRIQRFEDAILRATAEKIQREAKAAAHPA